MESTSSSNYRVVKEVHCVFLLMEFVGFEKGPDLKKQDVRRSRVVKSTDFRYQVGIEI